MLNNDEWKKNAMSKSNIAAFRIPAELQEDLERAITESGDDKSTWLVDAVRQKLNRPRAEDEMMVLIEQVREAAKPLIQHADNLMGGPYEEDEAIALVLQLRSDGIQDATITAQRLNEAGFKALGVRWDVNNYRNWAGDTRVMHRTRLIQEQRSKRGGDGQ